MEVPGDTVRVDKAGQLEVTFEGGRRRVAPHELFAIVLVWATDCTSCTGWLTTLEGWSVPFPMRAFTEPRLLRWLGELPGWSADRLELARRTCGLHLVWRCRTLQRMTE